MEISQKKAEEHRDEPIIVDSPQAIMANCIEKVGTLKEVQNDAIVQGWDDSFDEELVICGTLEKEDNATEASLELRLGNGVQENSKAQKVCDNFKEELIYPDLVKENIITTEENSETKKLDDSFEEELIYSDLTKEVENIIPAQKLDDSFEEELIYPKLPKELEDNTKVQEKSIAIPEKNVIVQEDIPIQKPSANITPIKIEEPVVGNEPVKETTDDSVKCRVIKGISKMPLQQDDIDDDFYDDDFYIPPHIEPVIPCVVEKKPIANLFPHSQTTPRRISTLIPRNTDSSRRLSQLRSRHIFGSYQNHLAPSEGSTSTGNITPNRNTQLILTKTTPNKRMLKDVAFSPNCYLFRDAPRDDHFNDDYNEDL
uniref:Uncharacterized protein n=1 Tax=Rhabditophanes sp. KR3021 TaxID=114890 RepID=A0AC35TSC2_9BILA